MRESSCLSVCQLSTGLHTTWRRRHFCALRAHCGKGQILRLQSKQSNSPRIQVQVAVASACCSCPVMPQPSYVRTLCTDDLALRPQHHVANLYRHTNSCTHIIAVKSAGHTVPQSETFHQCETPYARAQFQVQMCRPPCVIPTTLKH